MNAPSRASADGLYIGLISGTSMDGVDAVLVRVEGSRLQHVGALTYPYPATLSSALHRTILPQAQLDLPTFSRLHVEVGACFADAVDALLTRTGTSSSQVAALGSHGQTIYHAPVGDHPYTLQIGNPASIAARTGIVTVADFRAMDVAYGGEGAPLVPGFHAWVLSHSTENRVILNIGGIANLSLLPAGSSVPQLGYDTGPGNCLMDAWCARHRGAAYDADGAWAGSGTPDEALLQELLKAPYYGAPPPKSTGRETFNLEYLDQVLAVPAFAGLKPVDVQATLLRLTVETIARDIQRAGPDWAAGVFVCGGGARNGRLMAALSTRLAPVPVATTASLGLDPDMVEASAFAWLAWMRLSGRPVPLTTGEGQRALLLGCVYEPTPGYASA
ncbi:MAG: anhydro-N-acetylmuramic acid kinase [Gammaproteobacteria bacterium]